MNKKYFKITFLFVIFVQIGILFPYGNTTTSFESNSPIQKTNQLSSSQAPFTITSNSQFASYASSGNGSSTSPFILENYDIRGSNSSDVGITIENTTDYFILKNISVSNCGIGVSFDNVIGGSINNSHLWNNSRGIDIKKSSFSTFSGNNLSYNGAGILFWNTSADITVNGNIIDNDGVGVWSSMSFSFETGIINSFFSNNQVNFNDWGFYFFNNNQQLNDSFVNNTANNNKYYGFYFDIGINNTFLSNVATNNQHDGIYLSGGSNNTFLQNNSTNNGLNGFNFEQSSNNTLNGNDAVNNNGSGYVFTQGSNSNNLDINLAFGNHANGFTFTQSSSNKVISNYASNNDGNGFVFNTTSIDNTITSNTAIFNNNDGFFLENNIKGEGPAQYQITMIDNSAKTNVNNGIEINNTTFVNIAGTTDSGNLDGINIYNCYNVTLTNNTVYTNKEDGIHVDSIQAGTVSNNTAVFNGWSNYYHNNSQIIIFSFNNFPVNLPSEPQYPLFTITQNNEVNLTWLPPVTDGGGAIIVYRIYRSTNGLNYSLLGNTSKLFFVDVSPVLGKANLYEIMAVNSAGEGRKTFNFGSVVINAPTTTNFSATTSSKTVLSSPGTQPQQGTTQSTKNPLNFLFISINQVIPFLFLFIAIILSIIIGYNFITYRNSNLKVEKDERIPFHRFLRLKLKSRPRHKKLIDNQHDIDSALTKIDEILHENQTDK